MAVEGTKNRRVPDHQGGRQHIGKPAEGYGRFTPAERKLFYRYARGSFEETKAWLRKLIRREIITEEAHRYKNIIDELGPKLNAFIRSTKA